MAGVLSWVALSCASVGLLLVALVPSLTGRMWRTDAVELRRFRLFKEVLTANMSASLALVTAADPASGAVRRHDAGAGGCSCPTVPPAAGTRPVAPAPARPRPEEAPRAAARV